MGRFTVGLIIFFTIAMIVCISLAAYYGTRPIEYVTIMGEVRESHTVNNNKSAMYGFIAGSVMNLGFILFTIYESSSESTPDTVTPTQT